MQIRQLLQFGIFVISCGISQSANILAVFSFPGVSAFYYNKGIVESLHAAGHRLTFLTPFASKMKSSENLNVVELGADLPKLYHRFSPAVLANYTIYERMHFLFSFEEMYCSEIIKTKVIQGALTSKVKFDIMLIQAMFIPQCQLKIAEMLSLPVIGTIAFRKEMPMLNSGSPLQPAIHPHVLSEFGEKMSFVERFMNTWYYVSSIYFDIMVIRPKATEFCRRHFPQSPALPKISPDLFFIDSHSSILPRPLAPNFIEIAGVHITLAHVLTPKMRDFVDGAQYGCILFSLSSLVLPSEIPSEVISAFVEVFSRIPHRVIWKYDGTLKNLSDNVMLVDWVPQRDILDHKKVVAFISHCGLSSMLEAIYTATPVVALPLFTDQPSNAKLLEDLGVAVRLPSYTATVQQIMNALNLVINDERYRQNMYTLSQKFKDRIRTPQETVVYWTDYVLRRKGAAHLRTADMDMPFYQYLLLDVVLFVCGALALIFYPSYLVLKIAIRKFCRLIKPKRNEDAVNDSESYSSDSQTE